MSNTLSSKRPGFVEARIKDSFGGKFSVWRAGEKVKAWKDEDGTYTIERMQWHGALVPCCNSCIMVPESVLILAP